MKIKTKKLTYYEVLDRNQKKIKKAKKVSYFWRVLIKLVSSFELRSVKFKCNKINIDKLGKKEPCLFLMNHSSFIDMEIAYSVLYPRPFNVIATSDAFVGKNWLLREIGCMPTVKFINDPMLVRNIVGVFKKKRSVLLYPEAGYSMDGTTTTLPFALAKLIKFLKVPVATIITHNAYLRQPLYNKLRKRNVNVSCDFKYLLTKEQISQMTDKEIFEIISKEFSFDNFKYQKDNNIIIDHPERAEYLNSILYKCPHCYTDGKMEGHGIHLECTECHKKYELTELGEMKCLNGETIYSHIPDWYKFERQAVKEEILSNKYLLDTDVTVYIMKDTYSIYEVGDGHLVHNSEGYTLTLNDGSLYFKYPANLSYSINADIYWYTIGDIICVGDYNIQYYCVPKQKDVVVKARLATEELFKIIKEMKNRK